MKQPQYLAKLGWSVAIVRKSGEQFLGYGRNFFEKRADAVTYAKECRQHNLKAITRRVRLETI